MLLSHEAYEEGGNLEMPKPMQVVAKTYAGEPGSCDSTEHVTLADATRYANELAAEKAQELKDALYEPMKWRSELFANLEKQIEFGQKFAANPGVVTRAEFESLERDVECVEERCESIFSGDLTTRHTLDLRAEIAELRVLIQAALK
jgi:hypothetical protein